MPKIDIKGFWNIYYKPMIAFKTGWKLYNKFHLLKGFSIKDDFEEAFDTTWAIMTEFQLQKNILY